MTHTASGRRQFMAGFALATLVAACRREDSRPRCARCGMRVDPAGRWTCGSQDSAGAEKWFDAPKCMLHWMRSHPTGATRNAWVTEHYDPAGRRTPVEQVRFVRGADVAGPMGPDLVPVRADHVEGFIRDHHGTAMDLADVTLAVLDAL